VKFFFQPIYTDYANWAYFDKRSHLSLRAGLSDINLKGTHPGSIPARLGLIWFSGFRGEDLNMVLGWSPFNIVSDSPALHSRWLLLLKIEFSSITKAEIDN
jgi:hypothetical protein